MYRNGNYCAFYVSEPFSESALGAFATRDFVSYQMLRCWKGTDVSFPFFDSHNKTYDVRDGSDWEKTLKPRLHKRLSDSKNVIFFLSSVTKNSRALHEELRYAIDDLCLPIIVAYPEMKNKSDIVDSNGVFTMEVENLWDKIPYFRDNMYKVPTLHIPFTKSAIRTALELEGMKIQSKATNGSYVLVNC